MHIPAAYVMAVSLHAVNKPYTSHTAGVGRAAAAATAALPPAAAAGRVLLQLPGRSRPWRQLPHARALNLERRLPVQHLAHALCLPALWHGRVPRGRHLEEEAHIHTRAAFTIVSSGVQHKLYLLMN